MMDIYKNHNTKYEIEGQPKLWIETIKALQANRQIQEFLKPLFSKKHLNVILTGAGSSAFIGESVEHLFRFNHNIACAISTTTLVTHFKSYIDTSAPLLIISFARSGNSPESIAVVDIAESCCDDIYHIAITCNKSGQLAKKVQGMSNGLAIILPSAAEDQGLAMTGSFTSMMLTAIYLAKFDDSKNTYPVIEQLANNTNRIIDTITPALERISFEDFDRIVFLGSGPLLGIARESHLKVQELTDGKVVGKFDSFLGFRHGPKAVINRKTVLVFLFSSDQAVFKYEKDLVEEILNEGIAMNCIGFFHNKRQAEELTNELDLSIIFNQDVHSQLSDFDLLPYVIPAQILGFYKSLDLGLKPDNPSTNNSISRVVKGVKIYS